MTRFSRIMPVYLDVKREVRRIVPAKGSGRKQSPAPAFAGTLMRQAKPERVTPPAESPPIRRPAHVGRRQKRRTP